MKPRLFASIALLAALAALPACSDTVETETAPDAAADPLAGLAIDAVKVSEVGDLPLGTVLGMVTLPPEARVAVTTPFPGAAVRVYVIEGQAVRRGQPLALVRSAEPVQIRGDLSRARSEAGLAEARANRLTQLAEEGVIAQARADEARAALAQARATVAEQQRLASLGGVGPDGMMTLTAPISGRVAHVGPETGGPVDGMEAPFVIEAEGAYQVELQLPERLAKAVRPGMPVEIMLSNEGDERITVGGQILAVSPSIDPATRAVLARASIGAAPGIVAGRNVSVTIKGSAGTKGMAVPANAVTKIGGDDHVFVRDGKAYKPRRVTVVATTSDQAVISEGLKAGEVVAASSIAELKAMSAE
ncbi:efflux RND transporter periplasmic adaptor subunit [Pontixanthobacter luteolus]|uniref:efflux RND transporter periplasmic adaptor subunit n=1 Tax=Pontixanthobacter luteolus TaxID=295089 RepID=UPI00230322C8|nr:efflux RND transporter periplasmic adaptor subunit [Pontixanthobacter luteolus]